ncbi:hypothetical protein FNV43_RR04381 [Rhamnella rubrinervis]|uniref:Uncharacterized protein n=1 Tax=Rhamnella rubrinervis TaxID=2594499 RepID=A0A8K0HK71_9ROSA|nr:hypothetical protein FNV43_RR04381 [Rhamnella rubrinervis]
MPICPPHAGHPYPSQYAPPHDLDAFHSPSTTLEANELRLRDWEAVCGSTRSSGVCGGSKEYQSFRIGSDGNLQGVGLFINIEPRTGHLLRLTWEEAQDLLRPSPSVNSSIVTIEDHEFEESPLFLERGPYSFPDHLGARNNGFNVMIAHNGQNCSSNCLPPSYQQSPVQKFSGLYLGLKHNYSAFGDQPNKVQYLGRISQNTGPNNVLLDALDS